jgi:glycosyltransferase involved in cell wall biosynthesis
MRLVWEQTVLPRLLIRLGVDVHHSPHYTMPETSSVPRVVTIHDLTYFNHPEWHQRSKVALFRRAIRVAATEAEVIVCVSAATARRLMEITGRQERVCVIYHGVDHSRFRPVASEAEAARDREILGRLLGLDVDPYIAFIGQLEPRKDVPSLIKAFDRMCRFHPRLRLVLAGRPGWGSAAVNAALSQSPNSDRIIRTGYIPDLAVAPLLRQATAVAYPSLEEGFGLPALEALACGAPLVTTTGSAMEEVAEGSALLVAPGDVDGLAVALDMMARGDAGLAERRSRGIEIADRYSWEACAKGHLAAFQMAASTRVSSRHGAR